MQVKIIATDKTHLQYLIAKEIELHGNICDLNHLDVSMVNDMSRIFHSSQFKGDLSTWKPVNLRTNDGMFKDCSAPKPYWSLYELKNGNEAMLKAVNSYNLFNKLDAKMEYNSSRTKKIKI